MEAATTPVDWQDGLPLECSLHVFSFVSLASIARCLTVCSSWKAVCDDDLLWKGLVTRVWGGTVRTNTVAFKTAFKNRYRSYRNLHRQRLATHARLDVNLEPSPDGVARQVLEWTGASEQCHGNTVGVGILEQETLLWPCGRGNGLCSVVYYEVEILDAGEHGFIAVGWAQRDFEKRCKQPGWVRETFGYHGDDGCAYSGFGYGRRFGPRFTTGQTVGTGLVFPPEQQHGEDCEGGGSCRNLQPQIFFTVDGELIGTPFGGNDAHRSTDRVPRKPIFGARKLRPCVGLHSRGERVRINFGGHGEALLDAAPPSAPKPFAFDLTTHMQQLNLQASIHSAESTHRGDSGGGSSCQGVSSSALSEIAPFLQLLPWALHDVAIIALQSAVSPDRPLSTEDTEEPLRSLQP